MTQTSDMTPESPQSPGVGPGSDETGPACHLCAYAAENHWWGEHDLTHCHHCHATWRIATKFIHCVRCHRTFTTPGVLDKHLRDGRCHDPETMLDIRDNRIFGDPVPNNWGTPVHRGLPRDEPSDDA